MAFESYKAEHDALILKRKSAEKYTRRAPVGKGEWSPVSQNRDGVWTLHGEPCGSREEGEATYAATLEAIRLAAAR